MMLKGKFGEVFKKVFIVFAGLSFFWVTGSTVIQMMNNPQPEQVEQTATVSPEEQLQQAAKGYETVLENEPNNRFALEELVKTYLQLGDLQKALKPTEKLVEIAPENQSYQEVLSKIKAGLEQQKNALSNQNSATSEQSLENKSTNE